MIFFLFFVFILNDQIISQFISRPCGYYIHNELRTFRILFMEEVSNLPKLINAHSPQNGHLFSFQGSLSERLMKIIGNLQICVKSVSESTQIKLGERMSLYTSKFREYLKNSRDVVDSISTTTKSFDELREELNGYGNGIKSEIELLKKDCIELYNNSYNEIKPLVENAYKASKDILPQINPNIAERLPAEVSRLNANFIKTKHDMGNVLKQVENNAVGIIMENETRLEQAYDQWKNHRFINLVEKAKAQFDKSRFVDFGELFPEFYKEQDNFTQCFKKQISDVKILLPPNHFTVEAFNDWWAEVDDLMDSHENFIKTFSGKFNEKLSKFMEENNKTIDYLEKELVELKNENEANAALMELYPMFKVSQKTNKTYMEKIQKYWNYRRSCIKQSFEAIKNFLKPLIESIQEFNSDVSNIKEKERKTVEEINNDANETLKNLEEKLAEIQNNIQNSVKEDEIDNYVKECKSILDQIDEEYHKVYNDTNKVYDELPTNIYSSFEKAENQIIEHLHLTKLDSVASPESINNGITLAITNSSQRLNKSSRKTSRRRLSNALTNATKKKLFAKKNSDISIISCDYAKYQQLEPINLIPNFEDFNDDLSAAIPAKGSKKQIKKPANNPAVGRQGKSSQFSKSSKIIFKKDDFDDAEISDFSIFDLIPKINDQISIFVYIPKPYIPETKSTIKSKAEMLTIPEDPDKQQEAEATEEEQDNIHTSIYSDDVHEWKDEVQSETIKYLFSILKISLNWAYDNERRVKVAETLNERIRTHMPRMGSIQLNIAETRKIKVESKKSQLTGYFERTSLQFNNNLANLESQMKKEYENILKECEGLRSFNDELGKIKSTAGFSLLGQNKTIAEHNFENHFNTFESKQKADIKKFIDFYIMSNNRFKENVVLKDNISTKEEQQNSSNLFDKLNERINLIQTNLEETSSKYDASISDLVAQISHDYETALPYHKSDVSFLESLNSIAQDFKNKYEQLLFTNMAMEKDLQHTIDILSDATQKSNLSSYDINENLKANEQTNLPSKENNSQQYVNTIFSILEDLRQKLINRGVFLGQLKSRISSERITYSTNIDDYEPQETITINEEKNMKGSKNNSKKNTRPNSRNDPTRIARPKKEVKPPVKSKKNTTNKALSQVQSTKQGNAIDDSSLAGKLEMQRHLYFTSIDKTISDYYSSFKTRKFSITRPDQIPESQHDLFNRMTDKWRFFTQKTQNVIQSSNVSYRNQVIQSTKLTYSAIESIFKNINYYYESNATICFNSLKDQFEKDIVNFRKEREKNLAKINPKIVDDNNPGLFENLISAENERMSNEIKRISLFSEKVIFNERNYMNNFIKFTPQIVQNLLMFLDKYVLIDDLISDRIENLPRKTMKELLKDKYRLKGQALSSNSSTSSRSNVHPTIVEQDNGRPFKQREWPSLNNVMEPISSITVNMPSINEMLDMNNSGDIKKTKKKKRGDRISEIKSAASQRNLEMSEKTPSLSSLETPIHRTTIILWTDSYKKYEDSLANRLQVMKDKITSLEKECENYSKFWKDTIDNIKAESTTISQT